MKENKKLNFSIVDTDRRVVPDYEENLETNSYVPWGKDNQFPKYVKDLSVKSVTVNAIIEGTVRYILGNGIVVPEDAAKWKETINRRGETIDDLVEQVAVDLMTYGGFAIQIIYSRLGTVAEMYALEFGRCRSNKNNTKIYYAKKWGKWTGKFEEFDAYDPKKIDLDNPTQIYFYKGAARTVYPHASWEGAFVDASTEIEIGQLQFNAIANGLSAKHIITLPNDGQVLTDDEKEAIEDAIQQKFAGSRATSSFFLTWKEEGMSEVKVDTLKTEDESNKFSTIKKTARENIFVSFRCTGTLFGLPDSNNKGFSKTEFVEAFELYQETQVGPLQKKIIKVLNTITGSKEGFKVIPFTLDSKEDE